MGTVVKILCTLVSGTEPEADEEEEELELEPEVSGRMSDFLGAMRWNVWSG